MTPCVLCIPVYQSTSIPVAAVTHATLVLMTAPLDIDAPSSRLYWASRRHVDHFCPSRPGVTPGLQDHSYTSVWCDTKPQGPLSARVWCNTRPPGPPLPPSGELVIQLHPVGNSLELCRETPGIPQDSRTTSLSPPWNPVDSRRLAWWNQASRIPIFPGDFSERPWLYHPVPKVLKRYAF